MGRRMRNKGPALRWYGAPEWLRGPFIRVLPQSEVRVGLRRLCVTITKCRLPVEKDLVMARCRLSERRVRRRCRQRNVYDEVVSTSRHRVLPSSTRLLLMSSCRCTYVHHLQWRH